MAISLYLGYVHWSIVFKPRCQTSRFCLPTFVGSKGRNPVCLRLNFQFTREIFFSSIDHKTHAWPKPSLSLLSVKFSLFCHPKLSLTSYLSVRCRTRPLSLAHHSSGHFRTQLTKDEFSHFFVCFWICFVNLVFKVFVFRFLLLVFVFLLKLVTLLSILFKILFHVLYSSIFFLFRLKISVIRRLFPFD